jgi:hypothetical protein
MTRETGAMISPEHPAPPAAPNPELLRSLGRLVRGLSALFWGLPAALIICIATAMQNNELGMLRKFGLAPPVVTMAWLLFGLWQLGYFQRQERIWINALDRARLLALVNLGLSPFLFWWSNRRSEPFFIAPVQVLAVTGLLFLGSLNSVLRRLSAMLPDESLRQETRHFTRLNRFLVVGILVFGLVFVLLLHHPDLVPFAGNFLQRLGLAGLWIVLFLVLLPLAITMALIWKIKEVILDSVFGA